MSNVLITCKKELRGIFRDKKFLAIIFLMPFIIPAFIILMGYMYDSMENTNGYSVGVNYEFNEVEKNIMDNIGEDLEIVYKVSDEDLKNMYDNEEIDAYVIKENDTYNIYVDTSSTVGLSLYELLSRYYNAYNNYLANDYLNSLNINPNDVFNIVKVELKNQAKDGSDFITNFLISFALTYLVLIIAVTAMNTTTDIIAGEKERGTFETLLTFPIKSNEIIGGKLLAIVLSCIISSLIGISSSIPAFIIVKSSTKIFAEMTFNVSFESIVLAIISLILISCVTGVICIFLCGKAKSFKEAQSKLSILSFLALVSMFSDMLNLSSKYLYMIPVANGGLILNDIFLKDINYNNILLFIISSIIITIVVLIYISRQYKDEKSLF